MHYRFARFEIDSQQKQVTLDDKLVDADPRILQLIIALVEAYPEHLTKAALLEILWPDTVVSDWSVSKVVSDTRQLFRDLNYPDDLIQTLHGRGYRLSQPLGEQIEVVNEALDFTASPKQSKGLRIVIAAAMIVVVVGGLFLNSADPELTKSEPPDSAGRLLWVDDNPSNNQQEKAFLEQHNITVYQVTSTEDALTSLSLYQYNVVISDMGRDGEVLAGLKLLQAMRERGDETPFLLYTIVLSEAQQKLLRQYRGQGVAVEPGKLYQLVLPYYAQGNVKQSL